MTLPPHIAIVDDTGAVDPQHMSAVAGALNEQVHRDFKPVWGVGATVAAYPQAPPGTWAIHLQYRLDDPSALGYHSDDHFQPVAFVMATGDWESTMSHELLEMIVDPWGNRLHGGRLPADLEGRHAEFGLQTDRSHVRYLVEVCDPCEARTYPVGDIELSDWLMPAWYSANLKTHVSYSFAGGCRRPREVANGGYVSFMVPNTGEWFQVFNRSDHLQIAELGKFDRSSWSSLREFTDAKARELRNR